MYIRTKEGIIFYGPIDTRGTYKCTNFGGWKEIKPIFRNIVIIKQSDNPEEICDEFIWVTPEGRHHIKPKEGDGLWCLCCNYKEGYQVYGAIWTDKGLIYVAKMNDKGELELL